MPEGKNPPVETGHTRDRFEPWVRNIPWSRKWQPAPVFLSGKFHGKRSLAAYSSWDYKQSDTTRCARIHWAEGKRGQNPQNPHDEGKHPGSSLPQWRGTEQQRSRIPLILHQENMGRWADNVKLGRSWEPLDTGHCNDPAQASAEWEGTGHDQTLGVF